MRFAILSLILLAGCQPYVQAQLKLTEQLEKGVELCRQSQSERRHAVAHLQDLQRRQLDDAFDDDVQSQPLTAEWVIEHRRAYALALDALAAQKSASAAADRVDQQNLDAMLTLLAHLRRLQSAPMLLAPQRK